MMTTNKHRPACNTPTRVPEPRRMSDSMSRPINRKAFYLPSHRHWWKEGNLPLQGGFCKISSGYQRNVTVVFCYIVNE